MTTAVLNPIAVTAIRLYQRYLSRYKGFRCAHRALHHKWSCSEFGRRAFARYPWLTAHALLQRRFDACKRAYAAVRNRSAALAATTTDASKEDAGERDAKKRAWKDRAADACDPGLCDCPGAARGLTDVAGKASELACDSVGVCDCSLG